METLTIQSNDAKALEAIKVYAQKFDVQVLEDQKGNGESEQLLNGTQVRKLAAQFDLEELAGSLSDLNLDATELRKQAWEKKESAVLADSDVLIALSDNKKQQHTLVYETFQHFLSVETVVCISIITEIEMIQGSKNNIEKNRIIKFLKPFKSLNLLPEIALLARSLIIDYSASHGLLLGDSLIAATALHFNIPLFTFNKKDFRFIDGLILYEP